MCLVYLVCLWVPAATRAARSLCRAALLLPVPPAVAVSVLGLILTNTEIKTPSADTGRNAVPRLLPFPTGVLWSFPSPPWMVLCFWVGLQGFEMGSQWSARGINESKMHLLPLEGGESLVCLIRWENAGWKSLMWCSQAHKYLGFCSPKCSKLWLGEEGNRILQGEIKRK